MNSQWELKPRMNTPPDLYQAQLFLDDTWIEEVNFAARQWHQPIKYPEAVLKSEHPWEQGAVVAYGSVLHWRGKFRIWYIGFARPTPRCVCYAESDDGVNWHKPELGLCEFQGSRQNNIVLNPEEPRYIDNISIIDDADDEEWPLKALYWEATGHDWSSDHGNAAGWGIYAARSKDGIHWDPTPGLVLPQWIDRFNAASTRVDGKYVLWGRSSTLERGLGRNGRCVWRTESSDLRHWSEEKLVLQRDPEDPINMEYYSLSAFPYEGITLGGLERWYASPDRMDSELIWSHDYGITWQRANKRPAFLTQSPALRWDDTWVNLPSNAPIRHKNRLWFYYSGRSSGHNSIHPSNYAAIGLAHLRVDGFASLFATDRPATVLTKPMEWPRANLYINVDPRRDLFSHPGLSIGEVRVEVRDAANKPIKGMTWDECIPMGQTRDLPDACAEVVWQSNPSMRRLAGKQVRLAFRLQNAHLYSFRAR